MSVSQKLQCFLHFVTFLLRRKVLFVTDYLTYGHNKVQKEHTALY